MGRVLAQAVIIAGILNLAGAGLPHLDAPWLRTVADALGIGWYVPFSIAVALGLNNAKAAAIPLLVITLMVGSPRDVQACAQWLAPIGAGLLVGSACRDAIKEQAT